jgi:hypothetical protein
MTESPRDSSYNAYYVTSKATKGRIAYHLTKEAFVQRWLVLFSKADYN